VYIDLVGIEGSIMESSGNSAKLGFDYANAEYINPINYNLSFHEVKNSTTYLIDLFEQEKNDVALFGLLDLSQAVEVFEYELAHNISQINMMAYQLEPVFDDQEKNPYFNRMTFQ
jgi:hypothetical protein